MIDTPGLDKANAVSAVYQGFEYLEFIYIVSDSQGSLFHVFVFAGETLTDMRYTISKEGEGMIVRTGDVAVEYEVEDNRLVSASTLSGATSHGGRTECNVITGFLDCGNAIQDQLRSAVGDYVTFILELGCTVWVVCRGAVVVSCAAIGIGQCLHDFERIIEDDGKIHRGPSNIILRL